MAIDYHKSNRYTEEERTNKNIVEETRAALKELKIEPPYILMPHSISGLYSLWYAKNYPDEVEGMVGIDTSKPNLQKEFFGTHENYINYCSSQVPENNKLRKAMLNEIKMFYKNSKEFFDEKYQKNLPVLSFIASENIESTKNKKSFRGKNLTGWDILAKNMVSNSAIQKNIILKGSHYLYRELAEEIAKKTKEFLAKVESKRINLER